MTGFADAPVFWMVVASAGTLIFVSLALLILLKRDKYFLLSSWILSIAVYLVVGPAGLNPAAEFSYATPTTQASGEIGGGAAMPHATTAFLFVVCMAMIFGLMWLRTKDPQHQMPGREHHG